MFSQTFWAFNFFLFFALMLFAHWGVRKIDGAFVARVIGYSAGYACAFSLMMVILLTS